MIVIYYQKKKSMFKYIILYYIINFNLSGFFFNIMSNDNTAALPLYASVTTNFICKYITTRCSLKSQFNDGGFNLMKLFEYDQFYLSYLLSLCVQLSRLKYAQIVTLLKIKFICTKTDLLNGGKEVGLST